jgi:hypothetical protein
VRVAPIAADACGRRRERGVKPLPGGRRKHVPVGSGAVPYCAIARRLTPALMIPGWLLPGPPVRRMRRTPPEEALPLTHGLACGAGFDRLHLRCDPAVARAVYAYSRSPPLFAPTGFAVCSRGSRLRGFAVCSRVSRYGASRFACAGHAGRREVSCGVRAWGEGRLCGGC